VAVNEGIESSPPLPKPIEVVGLDQLIFVAVPFKVMAVLVLPLHNVRLEGTVTFGSGKT
jgi:hypothetical protein